jgi:hypothetical protein
MDSLDQFMQMLQSLNSARGLSAFGMPQLSGSVFQHATQRDIEEAVYRAMDRIMAKGNANPGAQMLTSIFGGGAFDPGQHTVIAAISNLIGQTKFGEMLGFQDPNASKRMVQDMIQTYSGGLITSYQESLKITASMQNVAQVSNKLEESVLYPFRGNVRPQDIQQIQYWMLNTKNLSLDETAKGLDEKDTFSNPQSNYAKKITAGTQALAYGKNILGMGDDVSGILNAVSVLGGGTNFEASFERFRKQIDAALVNGLKVVELNDTISKGMSKIQALTASGMDAQTAANIVLPSITTAAIAKHAAGIEGKNYDVNDVANRVQNITALTALTDESINKKAIWLSADNVLESEKDQKWLADALAGKSYEDSIKFLENSEDIRAKRVLEDFRIRRANYSNADLNKAMINSAIFQDRYVQDNNMRASSNILNIMRQQDWGTDAEAIAPFMQKLQEAEANGYTPEIASDLQAMAKIKSIQQIFNRHNLNLPTLIAQHLQTKGITDAEAEKNRSAIIDFMANAGEGSVKNITEAQFEDARKFYGGKYDKDELDKFKKANAGSLVELQKGESSAHALARLSNQNEYFSKNFNTYMGETYKGDEAREATFAMWDTATRSDSFERLNVGGGEVLVGYDENGKPVIRSTDGSTVLAHLDDKGRVIYADKDIMSAVATETGLAMNQDQLQSVFTDILQVGRDMKSNQILGKNGEILLQSLDGLHKFESKDKADAYIKQLNAVGREFQVGTKAAETEEEFIAMLKDQGFSAENAAALWKSIQDKKGTEDNPYIAGTVLSDDKTKAYSYFKDENGAVSIYDKAKAEEAMKKAEENKAPLEKLVDTTTKMSNSLSSIDGKLDPKSNPKQEGKKLGGGN